MPLVNKVCNCPVPKHWYIRLRRLDSGSVWRCRHCKKHWQLTWSNNYPSDRYRYRLWTDQV